MVQRLSNLFLKISFPSSSQDLGFSFSCHGNTHTTSVSNKSEGFTDTHSSSSTFGKCRKCGGARPNLWTSTKKCWQPIHTCIYVYTYIYIYMLLLIVTIMRIMIIKHSKNKQICKTWYYMLICVDIYIYVWGFNHQQRADWTIQQPDIAEACWAVRGLFLTYKPSFQRPSYSTQIYTCIQCMNKYICLIIYIHTHVCICICMHSLYTFTHMFA